MPNLAPNTRQSQQFLANRNHNRRPEINNRALMAGRPDFQKIEKFDEKIKAVDLALLACISSEKEYRFNRMNEKYQMGYLKKLGFKFQKKS